MLQLSQYFFKTKKKYLGGSQSMYPSHQGMNIQINRGQSANQNNLQGPNATATRGASASSK